MLKNDPAGTGELHRLSKQLCIATEKLLDERLEEYNLTATQGYLLFYIWKSSDQTAINITDLQKRFGYSKATLSGNVKKLRMKDYIRVENSRVDERQKKLIPTEKACQLRKKLEKIIKETEDEVYGTLNESEKKLLYDMSDKMMAHIMQRKGGTSND